MLPLFKLSRLKVYEGVLFLEIRFLLGQAFPHPLQWRILARTEIYEATQDWGFNLDGVMLTSPEGGDADPSHLEEVAKEFADTYLGGCAVRISSKGSDSPVSWRIWVNDGKARWRVLDQVGELDDIARALQLS